MKEYRLSIEGVADTAIHDGPTNRLFTLKAGRHRAFGLVDASGKQVLQMRRVKRNETAAQSAEASIWASCFQTSYRIECFDGAACRVHIPLFTARPQMFFTGEPREIHIQVVRQNLWRVFMIPGSNEALILSSLGLICSQRWTSSYGAKRWAVTPAPV